MDKTKGEGEGGGFGWGGEKMQTTVIEQQENNLKIGKKKEPVSKQRRPYYIDQPPLQQPPGVFSFLISVLKSSSHLVSMELSLILLSY